MTTRLSFIERIKVLSRDFINGKNVVLNRPPSYEVEILPASTPSGSRKGSLFSVHAIKFGAKKTAPLGSARANRLWLVNVEHTRSNLG